MENRYVYRSIEDGIGSPITSANSPHTSILRRLRRDYRESRDFAKYVEVCAISKAALYSHERFDVEQCRDLVADTLERMYYKTFPYIKKQVTEQKAISKEEYYAQCFARLEEMEKANKASKANAQSQEKNEEEDKHKQT